MLTVQHLRVAYGRTTAVYGLDLEVEPTEMVAIIGPNGAGKTSFVHGLFGVVPASGHVLFEGEQILGRPPETVSRRGMRLVPQGRRIFTGLTVTENLLVGASGRRDRSSVTRDVADAMERFPVLGRTATQPAGHLSGGEQQQLAIARAMMGRPRLLVLDEPSLGLAPLLFESVLNRLAELRDEGMTVLLVEQNAAQAIDFADRTVVLRGGRVVLAGTSRELREREDLTTTMLGF